MQWAAVGASVDFMAYLRIVFWKCAKLGTFMVVRNLVCWLLAIYGDVRIEVSQDMSNSRVHNPHLLRSVLCFWVLFLEEQNLQD